MRFMSLPLTRMMSIYSAMHTCMQCTYLLYADVSNICAHKLGHSTWQIPANVANLAEVPEPGWSLKSWSGPKISVRDTISGDFSDFWRNRYFWALSGCLQGVVPETVISGLWTRISGPEGQNLGPDQDSGLWARFRAQTSVLGPNLVRTRILARRPGFRGQALETRILGAIYRPLSIPGSVANDWASGGPLWHFRLTLPLETARFCKKIANQVHTPKWAVAGGTDTFSGGQKSLYPSIFRKMAKNLM